MEEWELDSPLSTWTLKHIHHSSSKPPTERKNDICDNSYPEFYKTTNQKGKPIRNKDKKSGGMSQKNTLKCKCVKVLNIIHQGNEN